MKPVVVGALCVLMGVAGCRGGKGGKKVPRPTPSPSPFAFRAHAATLEVTIPDGKGGLLAIVRGKSGEIGAPGGGTPQGLVVGTQAILYRDGKPALQIDAPKIVPDIAAKTLVATGRVVARTLGRAQTTVLRSDTMTWRALQNLLLGAGNVLLTQGDAIQVPAQRFTADTRLDEVEFTFGDQPATGKL